MVQAWEDHLYRQNNDKKNLKKINSLLKEIDRDPFNMLGYSEPLKYDLTGYWSRRITLDHRLVYRIFEDQIRVIQCRYHY
jgi:toxin YoeB